MCKEEVERYVKLNMSSRERSIIAQIRMGILPIRIETGRFTNLKINERICQFCNLREIEDEIHFIFDCELYTPTRQDFFNKIAIEVDDFYNMNNLDRLKLFNTSYVRQFAKFLQKIFQERKSFEHKDG